MLQKLRKKNNQKGFTLIELMIVIAIIGILAAIAIPNFIAYRNKSFCSRAESDANGISSAIADYFAIPTWVTTPILGVLNEGQGYTMSGEPSASANTAVITGTDPSMNITIAVTDGSGRCPDTYKAAGVSAAQGQDGWVGAGSDVYYQYIAA